MPTDPRAPASRLPPNLTTSPSQRARLIMAVGLFAGLLFVASTGPSPAGAEVPKWALTESLPEPRQGHTTTVLAGSPCEGEPPPDYCGKVLVTGGREGVDISSRYVSSALLYDPLQGHWSDTGALSDVRHSHVAVALTNGHVLVIGGLGESKPAGTVCCIDDRRLVAETYDPATGLWTPTLPMHNSRWGHTATLLTGAGCFPHCGKVLVVGGHDSPNSAELYDPVTRAWTPVGVPTTPRTAHTATLLGTGKVLIAGTGLTPAGTCLGDEASKSTCAAYAAELFDPLTATFTPTTPLRFARAEHSAARLADGRVLLAGGYDPCGGYGLINPLQPCSTNAATKTQIYDPLQATWVETGSMVQTQGGFRTAPLVPLPGDRLLAAAGDERLQPELYANGQWTMTDGLNTRRASAAAVLLDCTARAGRVLVAGGSSGNIPTDSVELYNRVPTVQSITPTGGLRGTRVQVKGLALNLGPVSVHFGDMPAIDVVVDADGRGLTATSPARAPGPAEVNVTVGGIPADTCDRPLHFGFVQPPEVDRILPDRGAATGGTTVKLVGKGLAGATAVHFGTAEVGSSAFQVNAAGTEITATTPAHDPGVVEVTVTAGGVASPPSQATRFTYLPVLRALEPSRGETTGGTTVAINGKGFAGAIAVRFGGAEAAFAITSDTGIRATSPSRGVPEAVPVTITTASGLEAIPEVAGREMFTYFEPAPPPDGGPDPNQKGPSNNDGAPVKPIPPGGSPGAALSPAPGGAPGPAPGPAPSPLPGAAPNVQPGPAPGSAPAPGTAPGAQLSPVGASSSAPAAGAAPGSAPASGAAPNSASATANAPAQGAATPLPGSALANPSAAPAVGDSSTQKGSERHAMARRRDDDRAAATVLTGTAAIALIGSLACFAELASRRRRSHAAEGRSTVRGAY